LKELLNRIKTSYRYWVSSCCPEFSDPADVEEANVEFNKKGTLAYIADLNKDLNDALSVKQVILMRTDLNMRKGKMVAQGAHASLNAFYNHPQTYDTITWMESGYAKVCLQVNSEEELLLLLHKATDAGLRTHLVVDEGRTEFNGVQTMTCAAIGPNKTKDIDPITSSLKLL
jgi:PTH2 family peptidyl-tRNA hydrolase